METAILLIACSVQFICLYRMQRRLLRLEAGLVAVAGAVAPQSIARSTSE